jgi:hypothetical protein
MVASIWSDHVSRDRTTDMINEKTFGVSGDFGVTGWDIKSDEPVDRYVD